MTQRSFEYGPIAEADLIPYASLLDHAFSENPTTEPDAAWQKQAGLDSFRVVRAEGQIAAGMGMLRMGQWFGGRSVPMSGIIAVVVAPEYRGSGVASSMMRSAMEEMRADGVAISALYASTQTIYRKMGYEQAGISVEYRFPISSLPSRERRLTVRLATPEDEPEMHRLYTERARQTNGNLDRHAVMWGWILREHPPVSAYIAERDGVAEGYVVYGQRRRPTDPGKVVKVRDLVAVTPDAGSQLLSFLGGHRRVADHMVWTSTSSDPLFLQVTEQDYTVTYYQQWLLRMIDVPAALEARGYPTGASGEVHLAVRDDILPANDGPLVLSVADGRAKVRPGGDGAVAIDVRGLSALYSGYQSPAALRTVGYLEGPDESLALLTTLFAGPAPWMPDNF